MRTLTVAAYIIDMGHINDAAAAAQESARLSNGRFGEQQRSEPSALPQPDPIAGLRELKDARAKIAHEVDLVRVRLAASRMPSSIDAVDFTMKDGRLLVTGMWSHSGPVSPEDVRAFRAEAEEVAAREAQNPFAVALIPRGGTRYAWEPTQEQRASTGAEEEFRALVDEYRELTFEQDSAVNEALTDAVPHGYSEITVVSKWDAAPRLRPTAAVGPAGIAVEIADDDPLWDSFRKALDYNTDPSRLGALSTAQPSDPPQWTFQPRPRQSSIITRMGGLASSTSPKSSVVSPGRITTLMSE